MNANDKSAYDKGYTAGRKKTEQEAQVQIAYVTENYRAHLERRDRVFCAALQGLLSSPRMWTRDDNEVKNLPQYIDLALEFAHAAAAKLPD